MKGEEILIAPPQIPRKSSRRYVTTTLELAGIGYLLWFLYHFFSHHPEVVPWYSFHPKEFDWYTLEPSENISWTECFDGQKCARLSLPLDYFTPDGPKTHIALQMIPATDRENYKGSILINPGGPGGSGTDLVSRAGQRIAQIVGPQFDILGFDPRGTGATTPQAQCFDSDTQFKQWALEGETLLVNLTDGTLPLARSRERLIAQRCLATIGGNGKEDLNSTAEEWGPGRFMSTPSVATDMLRIIEKLGQEKLQYWGFSYGTVLGQYFAAMYPDRVGRLVIDGVYDAEDYSKGLWDDNFIDMDKVINSFFDYCHQAGPSKCPLFEPTAKEIEARVKRIFATVEASPLPVPFAASGPALITRGVLQKSFFQATYKPTSVYKTLADQLHAVEVNNQTALRNAFEGLLSVKCGCGPKVQPWQASTEAFYAIAFGDSGPLHEQLGDIEELFARLYGDSAMGAPFWVVERIRGWEWKIEAKWRYTGPFTGNTSHPILVAQPTWDPVCPLAHGKRVQKRYSGAGFLEQRSFGHCTLSAPSVCTAKHIRAYFINGTLPAEGVVCEPDELPFIGNVSQKIQSVEDRELLDALRELQNAVPFWGPSHAM